MGQPRLVGSAGKRNIAHNVVFAFDAWFSRAEVHHTVDKRLDDPATVFVA